MTGSVRLVVSVELLDNDDKVADRVGKDVEVGVVAVPHGDTLDAAADVSEVSGNIWGDTPGAVWGHGPNRRTA